MARLLQRGRVPKNIQVRRGKNDETLVLPAAFWNLAARPGSGDCPAS